MKQINNLDWVNIRNEYVTGEDGLRTLAKKYNVSMRTVGNRSKDEEWPKLRKEYHNSSVTAVIEEAVKQDVNRVARIINVADTAIKAVEDALPELRTYIMKHSMKIKKDTIDPFTGKKIGETTIEKDELVMVQGCIDTLKLYQLTQAIKNLKDVQMLRSDKDEREQEARIKRLEAEAARADVGKLDEGSTGIVLIPERRTVDESVEEVEADGMQTS